MKVLFAAGTETVRAELVLSPFGDRAVMLRETAGRGPDGWRTMAAAARLLEAHRPPWVTDIVPAFETVTVVYDPCGLPVPHESVYATAASIIARLLGEKEAEDGVWRGSRLIDIPVCYGGQYGPDLAACAERAGLTAEAFAAAHSGAEYEAAMVGFLPGFPYLTGLPPQLAQPRLPSPRSLVPAGSVGIAGGQTGIYPLASPGGWQLIGRTPLRLFRPECGDDPVLLRAGDRVRFRPIGGVTFEKLAKEAPA